jgi:hypothetical protein
VTAVLLLKGFILNEHSDNTTTLSQTPPKVPKSPFTILLAPTTCVTPMTEDEDVFYDCL